MALVRSERVGVPGQHFCFCYCHLAHFLTHFLSKNPHRIDVP
jgi:hypothetical protein